MDGVSIDSLGMIFPKLFLSVAFAISCDKIDTMSFQNLRQIFLNSLLPASQLPARDISRFEPLPPLKDGALVRDELHRIALKPKALGINRTGLLPFFVNGFEVYLIHSRDLDLPSDRPLHETSALFYELGSQRERAFRPTEGTGKAFDLDQHDREYFQLITWDPKEQKIAAAYRPAFMDLLLLGRPYVGPVDPNIFANLLSSKMYTQQFFNFSAEIFSKPGAVIEASRSFVAPEYQKSRALFATWRGIGKILILNPRYHVFVGATSITRDFPPLAQEVIAAYLMEKSGNPQLANKIHPPNPFRPSERQAEIRNLVRAMTSIQDLSLVLQDIDPKLSVPPLIKSYTDKIKSDFFGAIIDPDFNTVDFATWMDATKVPTESFRIYIPDTAEREQYLLENHRLWRSDESPPQFERRKLEVVPSAQL